MRIVKIEAYDNGGHANQTTNANIPLPEGWAIIPEELATPNFPFGELTAEEIDGVMTVTSWTAGEIPQPEPEPDPQPTLEERMTAMETAVADGLSLFENDLGEVE